MIPVKQGGSGCTSDPDWCNYDESKWCNAVTIRPEVLEAYKNDPLGTPVMEDDILGYWVYIPRYAYQVIRWSTLGNTPIVTPEPFNIAFQHKDDTKYYPIELQDTSAPFDYRTKVRTTFNNSRCDQTSNALPDAQYKDQSCWATHPAFTFGKTELNGVWVGKFEVTGTVAAPTIKPNLTSLRYQTVGAFFSTAVNMSINPDGAAGGMNPSGTNYYPVAKAAGANKQNLSDQTQSRIPKNSDWGAVAYLTTSTYGRWGSAGGNEVWINNNSAYTTGCAGNSVSADSASTCNQYNTAIGLHASTTDNIYGVYDMSGGSTEYTMGNRGAISSTNYITTMPQTRYMDVYYVSPFGIKPSQSVSSTEAYYSRDICTFSLCGGQALVEVTIVQSVPSNEQAWFLDSSGFTGSTGPWALRSVYHAGGTYAGVFAMGSADGHASDAYSFHPLLSKF
jgi:hypothetical protein